MYYFRIPEAIRNQDVTVVGGGCTGLCLINMRGWSVFCWVGAEGLLTFGDTQYFEF